MIVSEEEMRDWLDIDEYDAATALAHAGVEALAKKYKGIAIESASYIERYDGEGGTKLFLDEHPITAVELVSDSFDDVIKIKNTSTDASNAYFTVTSSSLILVVDGGTNASTTTLAFSSYATLTALVTQIVATGKGWTAEVINTAYNSLETDGLIQMLNVYCGSYAGETASWQYLYYGEPLTGYEVYEDEGYIYYAGGFSKGHQNILVMFTAGYTATTMPADYQMGIMVGVKALLDRRDESGFGIRSLSLGGYSISYEEGQMLEAIFAQYLGAPVVSI